MHSLIMKITIIICSINISLYNAYIILYRVPSNCLEKYYVLDFEIIIKTKVCHLKVKS